MPGSRRQKTTHPASPESDRVSFASLDSGFLDLSNPTGLVTPQDEDFSMAQQWSHYSGTPQYGSTYLTPYYVQGYLHPHRDHVGYEPGMATHQHATQGYQPPTGYPGHYQIAHGTSVPNQGPVGNATQPFTLSYAHYYHAYPTFASMRASGQSLDHRKPYGQDYPPSPNSAIFSDPAPTFSTTSPAVENFQQPTEENLVQDQQAEGFMNHTTGTRQASISAWSKQVPAAGWDAAPPLADNGDHALAGFAGYPQQGQDDQYNQTNNFMPPQPQMMHTVTTTNAVGLEQPSPAMTNTSSLRQLRTEADDDVKMATGNDPDEIAEGRTCVNNRSSRFFQEPYAAQDERGFFHCPFAYKGNCKHEPKTKKCDYDKMVDAHIKQWRCTKLPHVTDACALPMSSSAIRFRHEREQHDDSSFWCLVEGCDRSKQVAPSKAFARQYNRNDHLHRKHGWSKELAEVQDKRWIGHDPETDPPAARAAAAGARKRRAGRSEQAEGKRLAPVDAAQARDVALARQRMARAKKHAKQKAALQEQRASAAPVETAEPAQGEDNSPLEGFMLPDMAQGHAAGLAPGRPASTRPQAHVHGQSQIGPVSRPSLNARHPVLVAASDIESFDNLDARSEDQKLAAEWIALFHAMHNDLHRYGPKTHAAMGSQAETDETLLRLQNGADLAFIERLEAKARKLAEGARAFLTRKAANEGVDPNSFR